MVMKYRYLILAFLFIFTSCEDDFLDNKPKGKLSDELLNSPDGIEALCIAAYAALAGPEGDDGTFMSPTTNWIYGDVRAETDRKSTRLNSSHVKISYAVFCLKKKKSKTDVHTNDRNGTCRV